MKEVQIETKVFKTIYRAIDGTEFTNKQDCEDYEKSAEGVIKTRFKKLVVAETDEWQLLRGDEGHGVYALKLGSQTDIDTVLQAYFFDNSWILRDENRYIKMREDYINLCEKALKDQDFLLMGTNCDGNLFFIDTKNSMIDRLNSLGKSNEDKYKNEET